jgi:hypothetical protein
MIRKVVRISTRDKWKPFGDSHFFKKFFSGTDFSFSPWPVFSACNTVHGLGEAIERGGKKTQDAADKVKRRLWEEAT